MVELAEIQAAYYMVAATGVLVAAVFYVLNLRATQRNMNQTLETRRLQFIDSIVSRATDRDANHDFFELLRYEWKDYEDFERKYGSENNPEGASHRYTTWMTLNYIGAMVKKGVVSADDIFDAGITHAFTSFLWEKYKPVIEEIRRRYFGQGYLREFEYLAGEMIRVAKERDPNYVLPETLDRYVPDFDRK